MGKREKRERRKAERQAELARRQAERRDLWRGEIRSQRCPHCGSDEVSRFLYGLPDLSSAELQEELDMDLVILAGCSFSRADPVWKCRRCHHQWGTVAEIIGT